MPAKSKEQQRLFGAVRAEQKGEDTGIAKAKEMAGKIAPDKVKHFAETKHEGLPEKKAEHIAFAQGFMNKCAQMGVSRDDVTRMTFALCARDSGARAAFADFTKAAFDLQTLPQATTASAAPCREAEAVPKPIPPKPDPTPEQDRVREIMTKKYASVLTIDDILAVPV